MVLHAERCRQAPPARHTGVSPSEHALPNACEVLTLPLLSLYPFSLIFNELHEHFPVVLCPLSTPTRSPVFLQ